MKQCLLSIIVPMYNAEKYIGTCLDSILNSDLTQDEYEIIVIDDGSTDNGPNIAREVVAKNPHMTYLTQANQGQSVARNNGIKQCQGKYVWCVDSDDRLDNHVKGVVETLKTNPSLDIMAMQERQITEGGTFVGIHCSQPTVTHGKVMKGREAIIQGYNPSSACALVIRKGFMEEYGLYFHVGMTHQDVELSYRLFAYADDVLFTDLIPYVYILHHSSTSQSLDPSRKIRYLSDDSLVIESFAKLAEAFKEKDKELYSVIEKRIKNIHFGMAYNLMLHYKEWTPLGINKAVIENMRLHNLFPLKGNFGNWKKNIMAKILNSVFA